MQPSPLARSIARLEALPAFLRPFLRDRLLGRAVPLVGTAKLHFEEVSAERVVIHIRNRRPVQNHIGGVHAAAMALLAETASGFCLGMHLPGDRLPLIKRMEVDYLRRSQGDLRAESSLSAEQIAAVLAEPKGELAVPVNVRDESGEAPIAVRMLWAWIPKKR
jgi:acyl-coenzyme A thioesterase PaaI-like protein